MRFYISLYVFFISSIKIEHLNFFFFTSSSVFYIPPSLRNCLFSTFFFFPLFSTLTQKKSYRKCAKFFKTKKSANEMDKIEYGESNNFHTPTNRWKIHFIYDIMTGHYIQTEYFCSLSFEVHIIGFFYILRLRESRIKCKKRIG